MDEVEELLAETLKCKYKHERIKKNEQPTTNCSKNPYYFNSFQLCDLFQIKNNHLVCAENSRLAFI